jgi:hypothetical protein
MRNRALVAIALLLLSPMLPAAESAAAAEATASTALVNPLAVHSLDQLTATRERPLFSPSRRPPPPPPPPMLAAAESVPVPIGPPTIILLGIVTEGGEARAMLRSGGSNKVARARLGDVVGSWTVTLIEARRLVLSHDDRVASYTLFTGKPGTNGAGGVPTPEASVQTVAEERMDRRTGRER